MSDVLMFTGKTTADIPVERVLDGAKHLEECFVMGYDKEGNYYLAGSTANLERLLWLCEQTRMEAFNQNVMAHENT